MPLSEALAEERLDRVLMSELDSRLDLLLANYQRVTANPRSMGYLRFLLKHYAKDPHPFRACLKDNLKRFGPGRAEKVCAVIKDSIRQTVYWRHGHGGHSRVPDTGAPGVAIAEADAPAANPPWHGNRLSERPISLLDKLDAEFGVRDHSADVLEAFNILFSIEEECDVYRVLLGLDEPPHPKEGYCAM